MLKYMIGIDAGGTHSTAIAYDENGKELKGIEIGLFIYNITTYKEKLEKIISDEELLTSQNNSEGLELEKLNL